MHKFNLINLKIIVAIFCAYVLGRCIIIGMPWFYFFGFIFVLALAIIFVRYPKKFLIYLLFFRAAIDPFLINVRFSVAGVDLGFGGSLSILLMLGAIFNVFANSNAKRIFKPISIVWIFFCMINVIAVFYSWNYAGAIKANIRYLSIFSIFILSATLLDSEEDVRHIGRAIIFSGVLTAIIGVGYNFVHPFPGGRFAATLGHPNILSFYLLILIGCLFSGIGGKFEKGTSMVLYSLFFLMLILTKTRSGWLAFVVMMVFYTILFNRKLFFSGVILIAFFGFIPMVQQHIANVFLINSSGITINPNASLGWRFEKWGYLWQAFLQSPFKGHGIEAATQYGKDVLGAHNDYLKYLVETGIFGLIAAYLPYFMVINRAFSVLKKNSSEFKKRFAMFIVIFVPAFLIMSISENLANYIVIHWYLWAILGAFYALDSVKLQRIIK